MFTYSKLAEGYKALAQHRSYWEFDNDYKHKFRIIEDSVQNWDTLSDGSKPYVGGLLAFMLDANKRIFKH